MCDNLIEWNKVAKWKTMVKQDGAVDPTKNYDFSADSSIKEDLIDFIENKLKLTEADFVLLSAVFVVNGQQMIVVNYQSSLNLIISVLNHHCCKLCASLIAAGQESVFCVSCMGYAHCSCANTDAESVDEGAVCQYYNNK